VCAWGRVRGGVCVGARACAAGVLWVVLHPPPMVCRCLCVCAVGVPWVVRHPPPMVRVCVAGVP
jgi:hypothetical protein